MRHVPNDDEMGQLLAEQLEEEINAMPALDDESRELDPEMEPEDLSFENRLALDALDPEARWLIQDVRRVARHRLEPRDVAEVILALRYLQVLRNG
jgi:hypothetical protein